MITRSYHDHTFFKSYGLTSSNLAGKCIDHASVTKNLLKYRYDQLAGAYHNAQQQGLKGALYPMVTFNGIECHNEWEITFEEIHRNGTHYPQFHAIFDVLSHLDRVALIFGLKLYQRSHLHSSSTKIKLLKCIPGQPG